MTITRSRLLSIALVAAVIAAGGIGYAVYGRAEVPSTFRTMPIERGTIVSVVTATGKVDAVTTVIVGSQVSGRIRELSADFNTPVKAGQVIARLDDDTIAAKVLQAEADLASARASILSQKAAIDRAHADYDNMRAQELRARVAVKDGDRELKRQQDLLARGVSAQASVDKADTTAESARAALTSAIASTAAAQASIKVAEAQLEVAQATAAQREANLRQVRVDLDNTVIRAPIDGVVVQRNVDVGQTVAASLQAPVLFSIAQDLRLMQVLATIDEADVGRVQEGQPVTFTVNAYPEETFRGTVLQIRLAPQIVQNVVTYTVVVSAENSRLKLLPGMTANVRVLVGERADALRVPNAALRFRPAGAATGPLTGPPPAFDAPQPGLGAAGEAGATRGAGAPPPDPDTQLRRLTEALKLTEDQQAAVRPILESQAEALRETTSLDDSVRRLKAQEIRRAAADRIDALLTAEQKPRYAELRTRIVAARQASGAAARGLAGQVYVLDEDGAALAIPVRLGVSDGSYTEVVEGKLTPGQHVVVGGRGPIAAASAAPVKRNDVPRLRL